jgi:hypothetical protein
MKCYIIQRDQRQSFDFTIMKVKDDQIAQFEQEHKDRILAIGDDVQEVIMAFGRKENQWQAIDLSVSEEENLNTALARRNKR